MGNHAPILMGWITTMSIFFGGGGQYEKQYQNVHGDQTILKENFYMVDHAGA